MPATSSLCLRPLPSCPCADAGMPDLLGDTGLSGVTSQMLRLRKRSVKMSNLIFSSEQKWLLTRVGEDLR